MRFVCLWLSALLALIPAPGTYAQEARAQAPAPAIGHMGSSPPAGAAQEPDPGSEAEKELQLQLKPVEAVANDFLKRAELQHSLVGLEILHIPSSRVLFSFNGRRRFVPASITKVLTTACAMDTLGADYKFKTALVAGGPLKGSVLSGSLYLLPCQDPTFKTEDLRQMLSGLKAAGVRSIEGTVEVASVEGGGDHFSSEWLAQDWGQDWMPVSSDLVIDRNVVVGRDAGRGYKAVSVAADGEGNALLKSLLQSPWAPAWASFHKQSNSVKVFHGSNPQIGGLIVGNPGEYNLAITKSLLKDLGIKIEGHVVHNKPSDEWRVSEHESKPLSSIIRYTLKESDNLYAQQLLRTLGALSPAGKNLEKASLEERGLARLSGWLASVGVTPSEVVLYDGCGLSRKDCLTPHALNMVLRHMAGSSGSEPYADLLIHDGEGTSGTFRFKTGAMDSVRSLSGIVRTAAGEPLAVSIVVNAHNPSVRQLRASLSSLIASLQSLGSLTIPAQGAIAASPEKTAAGSGAHKSSARQSLAKKGKATPACSHRAATRSHVGRRARKKR